MSPSNGENRRASLARQLRWHRLVTPIALLLAVVSVGINPWLAYNQRAMISPSVVQGTYWVSGHEASKEYLQDMADMVLTFQNTVTPSDAEYRSQRILKMVRPDDYGVLAAKFKAAVDKLKADNLSTVWSPGSVGVIPNTLCVKWSGAVKKWMGEKVMPPENKSFLVAFGIDRQGTLYLRTSDEYSPDLVYTYCR